MMRIEIPGWGNMEAKNLILDMNGTIATDGKISPEVKEKINLLSQSLKIYVLTADTHGTASKEVEGLTVELIQVPDEDSKAAKGAFLSQIAPESTIAIGNGSNDQFLLREAALGIAVLGDEGLSLAALQSADVVVQNISQALSLLLKPKRLTATLKE
jgi:soluble P-type ATPase